MKSATQPKLSVVIRFILILLLCGSSGHALASERIAIAIVPPQNLSRDTNTDHWQYTLPQLLSADLTSVKRIKECPESSLHFALHELKRHRGDSLQTAEVQKVGEIMEARWVLFGSYQQESNQLTLTMQAMNVSTGIISRKRTASGAARMKVVLEVARGILRDLGVTPSAEEEQKMKQGPTRSEEALEFLSRACADIQLDRPIQACEQNLRRTLAVDPESPVAQLGLSHILLLENRLDEAEHAAKLAVTNRPDHAGGHGVLGQVYCIKGLKRAACDELLEAARLDPDDGDYQMSLASIYSELGKTREARSAMEQAESLDPYNPPTHAGLSLIYSAAGERDKALKEANLSERYCTGADGADEQFIACAYDSLNEVAKAVEHYEKFVSHVKGLGIELPDLKGAEERLAQLKAALTPHFVAASAPRDYTPAELDAALKARLTPGEYVLVTNPLSCTPEMKKWAKQLTGDAKKPEEKARKLFETLARHLRHEHAFTERTATQVFKAWPDEKESFTCQENTLLYLALARSVGLKTYYVYINRDFASNAIDHACVGAFFNGKPLLIDPSYEWFGVPHQEYHFCNDFEVVGLYLMQKPNVPSREVAVKLIPDFPTAYFNLASRLAETNQLPAARAALDKGLKLDSQSWHALLFRAEVEGYEKNFGDAEKHLQAALVLNPGCNSAHFFLGSAWLQDGRRLKEAREEYRKYLQGETDPDYADYVLKALAWINASLDDTNTQAVPDRNAFEATKAKAGKGDAEAQYILGVCYDNGRGVTKDESEAVKWYRKAADQNNALAQYTLGVCYDNSQGVTKDESEAVKWYRKAAEQNLPEAQYTLGVCYDNGQGVPKDASEAGKWYRKAADQNNALAQYSLGVCYDNGQGMPKDASEAGKWYRKAADQNNVDAQGMLGYCYFNGQGVAQDYAEAVKWYRKAADQNNADAQYGLGYCYYTGQGVPKDASEAVKWYRKAGDQNNVDAQGMLGYCYFNGQGVAQDYSEAVKWYRKAADQNNAEAQCSLGACYANGQGVPKDESEGVKWYRKAADQNNAEAQYNLGGCYESGQGVTKDYAEAVKWYRKAADQNFAKAQSFLGICYFKGKGVTKDYVMAYKWCLLAAAQDFEDAKKGVAQMKNAMTKEQIAEGQKLVRDFKPQVTPSAEGPR